MQPELLLVVDHMIICFCQAWSLVDSIVDLRHRVGSRLLRYKGGHALCIIRNGVELVSVVDCDRRLICFAFIRFYWWIFTLVFILITRAKAAKGLVLNKEPVVKHCILHYEASVTIAEDFIDQGSKVV